jgi:hypothetical protein
MKRRSLAALCALSMFAALVSAAVPAFADPGVTPTSVTLNLPPGGSTTVAKTVSTPPIPPNPDIVFLVDTTTSMGPVIADVQNNAPTILSDVQSAQPSAEFAVAEYKDVDDGAAAYTVLQNLTPSQSAAQTGLNNLTPLSGGGQDASEDGINGLFQTATGAISFRPGSARVIVWIGDSSSHDPSLGHSLGQAITALNNAAVRVLALDVGPTPNEISDGLDNGGQATAVTTATGGHLFSGVQPNQVSSTILSGLHNLPVTVTYSLSNCDPNLSVTENPSSRTVTSGDDATFSEGISVSPNAVPGSTITCTVNFLLNGSSAPGFSESITEHVPKASPTLSTTPSGSVPAGGNLSDSASLSGAFQPTGAVTFRLFGPGDASCSSPIATLTGPLTGTTANSGIVAAGGVGTYRWTANYPGDAHNNAASSPCGSETVVVVKATPTLATHPSGSVPAGGNTSDTATISGGFQPTGTVTFRLYAPGDATCQNAIATRTATLTGGSAATGDVPVGAAGTYNWVASYSGDANNNAVTGQCGDEPVVVTPQVLTGRAYGLAASATLLGVPLVTLARTPDTGAITTTSSMSTSVPCVATLSGLVSAHALCANVTTTAFPGKSVATASVDDTTVGIPGLPVITVRAIQSTSTTTCGGSSGSTTIAFLKVGNTVVISSPTPIAPNTGINVGVVKLVLNEQVPVAGPDAGLTVNAVHVGVNTLGLAKTDVVIASSESDIGNCP